MKRFLLLLTTVLAFTGWAAAESVTLNALNDLNYETQTEISGKTDNFTDAAGNTVATITYGSGVKYYKSATTATIRLYNGNSITLTPAEGVILESAVFKTVTGNPFVNNKVTASSGTFTVKSTSESTWTAPEEGTISDVTITNSNSKNTQITEITLTYSAVSSKFTPSLAWSEASCTQYLGATELEEYPTLTNDEGFEVSYTSSNPEVATISTKGEVAIIGKGTTTIAAKTEATEEYKAGNATYTLRVVEPSIAVGGYNLLTNLDELDGAQGIIVSEGETKYALEYKSGSKCDGVAVSVEDGVVADAKTASIINFAKVSGGYNLEINGQYLSATSSKTDLKPQATASAATIELKDGYSSISFGGSRLILVQNPSTFGHYAASNVTNSSYRTVNIYIYKEGSNAPVASHTVTDVEGQPGMVKVELSCDNENARIYYLHAPAAGAFAAPANGYTRYTEPLIVPQGSTINYYAEHKGIKSDEVTVSATTGVEGIVVDGNAETEYFDLHGRRVANPTQGVYVRRIGATTTKVVL